MRVFLTQLRLPAMISAFLLLPFAILEVINGQGGVANLPFPLFATLWLLAFIFFLGGLWAFIRPINTFFALVSVLGLILVFYGAFEIVRAVSTRALNPYWWIGLLTGILLILLAFWVSGSDRVYALQQRTYLILFWVGFMALFKGITQIVMAFGVRHVGELADTGLDPATT